MSDWLTFVRGLGCGVAICGVMLTIDKFGDSGDPLHIGGAVLFAATAALLVWIVRYEARKVVRGE